MLKNSIVLYTAIVLTSRVASIGAILLLAFRLSVVDFGYYAFLQASITLIALLSTMNVTIPVAVVLARSTRERIALENVVVLMVMGAMTSAAIVLATVCITVIDDQVPIGISAFALFAALCVLTTLLQFGVSCLLARGQQLRAAATTSLAAAVTLGGIAALPHPTLDAVLATVCLANAFACIFGCWALFGGGVRSDLGHVARTLRAFINRRGRSLAKFSLLTFAGGAMVQASLWLLQRELLRVGGPEESAIFGLGNQLYNVAIFLPGVLSPILLRKLTRSTNEAMKAQLANRAALAAILCAVLGVSVFGVVATTWALPVLPREYASAGTAFTLAVAAGAAVFAKFPMTIYFQSKMAPTSELIAAICCAAAIVAGSLVTLLVMTAEAALLLRSVAHGLQFLVLLAGFVAATRVVSRE